MSARRPAMPAHGVGASSHRSGPTGPSRTGEKLAVVDPLAAGADAAGLEALCRGQFLVARQLLESIRGTDVGRPEELSFQAVMEPLDLALFSISNGADYAYLLGVAHPDEAVRRAARRCETEAEAMTGALWRDPKLAARVGAYAESQGLSEQATSNPAERPPAVESLTPERIRFVRRALRDFRRRGALLGPHADDRLRRIEAELTLLAQQFVAAITHGVDRVRVPPRALDGLPQTFRQSHPPEPDGLVTLTTDYPDYFPVLTHARDRALAQQLYVRFVNRGGEANLRRLDRLLALRYEKAQLLGYRSWADYVLEPRTVGSVAAVRAFLERTHQAIRPSVAAELARFRREGARLGVVRGGQLDPTDRYYLGESLQRRRFGFDSTELDEYFDSAGVTRGLLQLAGELLGLEFRPVQVTAWHPDVRAYDVVEQGRALGRIFFDLYSRPGKYKHAAMFPIRGRRRLPDGTLQTAQAALLCNFPPPGEAMPHGQVVTYFHEFGHLLHHILTEAELALFAGTHTVRDFVEVPSQVFEQLAWSWEVLRKMARHRRTGALLSRDLFEAMTEARRVGLALALERQLYLAALDLEYHARRPGFDTTELLRAVRRRWSSFAFVEGTHFQSSFGHLIGYDAGYYAYPFALLLAWDAYGPFESGGQLDAETARRWRRGVLAPGGGADELGLLRAFLGREPDEQAYLRFVGGAGD